MDRSELAMRYGHAGSIRRLAEQLGVTWVVARRLLLQAGVELSDGRGSANKRRATENRPTVDERALWESRYEDAGSVSELARRLGKSSDTIRYHLRRHGVEIKRTGFKAPRTVEIAKGSAHHNWKGGTTMHPDGYVLELAPGHPAAATQKGYVLQHRLVMEKQLGRFLTPNELVHHKNEIKTDNRPENLELMSRSRHISHHKEHFPRDANGRFSH